MLQHTDIAPNSEPELRLLLAEHEWIVMRELTYLFKRHGYQVVQVDNGREAERQLLAETPFDVAILGVALPQVDGFEVLHRVREEGVHTPVVMLSARDAVEERLRGFALGADDFVTRPVTTKELLARVEALLRRGHRAQEPPVEACRLGEVEVNFATHTARRGEEDIALTPLEFEVLRHLARRRGRVVSREEFKREVWKMPEEVETRTMDRHIIALRRKIERDPSRPRFIKSVFGVGYKLEGGDVWP